MNKDRRELLRRGALLAAAGALSPAADGAALSLIQNREAARGAGHSINVDPRPLFEVSPYLYMQFMEPLGATDGSVEAAWDYDADDWRQDFVETTADLSPQVMRWGGLFSRYYRWRESVGPIARRVPMRNYVWGGVESNRVGTHEFVDFCRRVGAEPLLCVNFMSDGERRYWKTERGGVRTADAREAADWVSYCNEPNNKERLAHAHADPYRVKLWQIGNETSYGDYTFAKDEAIRRTIEFARAMKERDRSVSLIGWGDKRYSKNPEPFWAGDLIARAGEHLDYVAMHMMHQSPKKQTVLRGFDYQKEPETAWNELQELADDVERRITEFENHVLAQKSHVGIAVTEGHLSLSPHNSNPILQEWLCGVYQARSLNSYLRHGASVKIATAADFQGTRWTVSAVMMPVPRGKSYLLPVGSIARLYRKHCGRQGVAAASTTSDLDIAATRTGEKIYLHVANRRYAGAIEASFAVRDRGVIGGKVFEIAPADLRSYVNQDQRDTFTPREKVLEGGPAFKWRFPAGSVSVVELDLRGG